ncbi:MAG: hypothetical protein JWO38_3038 [Gemmataceae bacterium]|nr:hypothetical protein [Gemmataceae bacterium]
MTEAEWLAATDPTPMLKYLNGPVSLWVEIREREPILSVRYRSKPASEHKLALFESRYCRTLPADDEEAAERCEILRCIFGNPFRPVTTDPSWLTSTVLSLARQMYESRDFSPMPILADALQDAGCDQPDILAHCRGDGPHVRGCWVVDLVLGKT